MSTGINIGKAIKILDEGVTLTSDVAQIDFTGTGVTATTSGNNVTVNVVGATGVWGISNASGVYTLYSTLTLAMAAAVAGQTIELFADVTETGNVTVNLKDGVNINLNGHTYTVDNAGTANCLQDNGVAVNVSILNGIIKRVQGNASATNTLCLYVTGASTILGDNLKLVQVLNTLKVAMTINNANATVSGMYCIGGNPTIVVSAGRLLDSTAVSGNGGGINNAGIIKNCYGRGINVYGINNSGTAYNCIGEDFSVTGFNNTGYAFGCTGNGYTGYGAGGININCIGFSSASTGFYVNGGSQSYNCSGYSTAGNGIYMINGRISNCTAYSAAGNALGFTNSGSNVSLVYNCTLSSLAAATINANNSTASCKIYNSFIECTWNNASGHGIVCNHNGLEIVNNSIIIANASANAINAASAKTISYANNAFKGATTPVNANITQGITNTHDNQGNILI